MNTTKEQAVEERRIAFNLKEYFVSRFPNRDPVRIAALVQLQLLRLWCDDQDSHQFDQEFLTDVATRVLQGDSSEEIYRISKLYGYPYEFIIYNGDFAFAVPESIYDSSD